jgi:hypothetical protein
MMSAYSPGGRGRGFPSPRLTNRVELRQADISTETVGEYHLVIANLEVQTQAWADSLRRHVHRPGQLLVSGFLTAEAGVVLRRYENRPS